MYLHGLAIWRYDIADRIESESKYNGCIIKENEVAYDFAITF